MTQSSVKLLKKTEIADHVFELRFEKPEGFEFQAGQFVQFLFPDGGKMTPRSYSISSTPADDFLEFCVRFLENGLASSHFAAMNEGDEIEMKGPQGRFLCNPDATHHVYVATGAGMAPIMGMIRDELEHNKSGAPIDLLFGVRAQKDIFWTDRLEMLSNQHENFNYRITLSQPEEGWDGLEGRVTAHLDPFGTECHVYLCGSGAMVMDVRKAMIAKGCSPKQMHFEIF